MTFYCRQNYISSRMIHGLWDRNKKQGVQLALVYHSHPMGKDQRVSASPLIKSALLGGVSYVLTNSGIFYRLLK